MTPQDLMLMASRFRKRAEHFQTEAAISRSSDNTSNGEKNALVYDQYARDCAWAAEMAEREAEMEKAIATPLRVLALGAE